MVFPLSEEAGEKLPQEVALHVAVQVTPLFAPSFVSVAENVAVAPVGMASVVGETETAMGG